MCFHQVWGTMVIVGSLISTELAVDIWGLCVDRANSY